MTDFSLLRGYRNPYHILSYLDHTLPKWPSIEDSKLTQSKKPDEVQIATQPDPDRNLSSRASCSTDALSRDSTKADTFSNLHDNSTHSSPQSPLKSLLNKKGGPILNRKIPNPKQLVARATESATEASLNFGQQFKETVRHNKKPEKDDLPEYPIDLYHNGPNSCKDDDDNETNFTREDLDNLCRYYNLLLGQASSKNNALVIYHSYSNSQKLT